MREVVVQAHVLPQNRPIGGVAAQPDGAAAIEAATAPLRLGAHISIRGGAGEALELACRLGCTTLQIFSASPRMWSGRSGAMAAGDAAKFRERRKALGLDPLVIHANYLINLAAPDRRTRSHSIRGFRAELERAVALGADLLVVHPGSRRGSEFGAAIERIAGALRQSSRGLALGGLRVLIEGTAGQGSVVGSRIEELRAIMNACPELDLGICLDTAHLLAAGYEIRGAAGLEATLEELDRAVGLERVRVVHVNDSKTALGSRADRHEHLGRGHIGLEALGRIVNHPQLAGRAFILETPIERPGDDRRNMRALRRLAGLGGGSGAERPAARRTVRAERKR